jgi:hypothetical protein
LRRAGPEKPFQGKFFRPTIPASYVYLMPNSPKNLEIPFFFFAGIGNFPPKFYPFRPNLTDSPAKATARAYKGT